MPAFRNWRRKIPMIVLIAVVIAALSATSLIAAVSDPMATPTASATSPTAVGKVVLPTPQPPPDSRAVLRSPTPVMSIDEARAQRQRLMDTDEYRRIRNIAYGPQNSGGIIVIRGISVVIPQDAYIDSVVVDGICVGPPSPCPDFPIISIVRGKSRISFSKPSGGIVHQSFAPGEERTFAFLQAALR